MSIHITYLGHSGFVFSDGKHSIAVDPFLTGNPLAKHKPGDVDVQYIGLTHGHADHISDTTAIAKKTGATVIAPFELANYMGSRGVNKTESGNPGGRIATDFGWVAFTQAFHSSSYEGQYMGVACGMVVRIGDVTVYHCGDTGIFGDMKLLGEIYEPDVACVPIGDRFTMGPGLATKAAEMIGAPVAIPMHYKTFGALTGEAKDFVPAGIQARVMEIGEEWTFDPKGIE